MKTLSVLLIGLALCSCDVAGGNRNQGTWVIASLGTDVGTRNITPDGMNETNVNQSASFGVAMKTVQKLWNAYLTAEGLVPARDGEAGKRALEELKITTDAGLVP